MTKLTKFILSILPWDIMITFWYGSNGIGYCLQHEMPYSITYGVTKRTPQFCFELYLKAIDKEHSDKMWEIPLIWFFFILSLYFNIDMISKYYGSLFAILPFSRLHKKEPIKWFSLKKAFLDSAVTEKLITLGNSLELSVLFKRIGWRITSACFSRRGKLSSRLRFLGTFAAHVLRLHKHKGGTWVVKYLKACQLAVQKVLAGSPLSSLNEINGDGPWPRLDRRGLPVIIPVYDRRLIKQGSASVIRWWLTLFGLYRIIKVEGVLKLNTITDPLSVPVQNVERVSSQLSVLADKWKGDFPKIRGQKADLCLLETASPNFYVSWAGLIKDHQNFHKEGNEKVLKSLLLLMNSWKMDRLLALWDVITLIPRGLGLVPNHLHNAGEGSFLGSLCKKEEAAGKIRIFAMVEVWTQSVLTPLQDSLFSYLKSLPNDATFDQGLSVKRCFEKVSKSKGSWGFDLSAATDRLPLSLQISIINTVYGAGIGEAWGSLLTDRSYAFSQSNQTLLLKYSVGQPMGAKSSWAMLAVTHHLLVQLSAHRAGKIIFKGGKLQWYDNYELLGDDIVIFNKEVADQYLLLMEEIGVAINLTKSVISPQQEMFEFAKVTGYNGKDVSALSWKAFLSQNTFIGRIQLAFSLLKRPLGLTGWVSWLTGFVKHQSKKLIGAHEATIVALWTMFMKSGKVPVATVIQTLINLDKPLLRGYRSTLLNVDTRFAINYISWILKGNPSGGEPSYLSLSRKENWEREWPWVKIHMSAPYLTFIARYDHAEACQRWAKQMVEFFLPQGSDSYLNLNSWLNPENLTKYDEVRHSLFLYFYMLYKNKVDRLLPSYGRYVLNESLETIQDCVDSIDRIKEIQDLIERSKRKDPSLNLGENSVKEVSMNSLKVLRNYLKGLKRRPNWVLKQSGFRVLDPSVKQRSERRLSKS